MAVRKELLRISHVSLERDGEQLLDNLEFQMFAGEIFGLVARNRKGQKEMVDLICRNDPITLGSVWYDGKIVNSYSYSSGESNKVALIEQKSHLVQGLSVVDNLFILREGFKKYFINEQVIFQQAVRFMGEQGLEVELNKGGKPFGAGAVLCGARKSIVIRLPSGHRGQSVKLPERI